MSTRSKIGIIRKDNTIDHIYSHWDGYLEHNGVILIENYNNINKINELIKNGDMSVLAEHIYPTDDKPHSFDYEEGRQDDVCLFYNRDRGEDWKHTNPRTTKNLERFIKECCRSDCEFAYLYDENNNEWLYSEIPWNNEYEMNFKPLKDGLIDKNINFNDDLKEDYLIFDGMELMKDIDYYEYMDQYNSNKDAYFDIKNIFEKKEFKDYFNTFYEYMDNMDDSLKEDVNKYLNDVKDYYVLDEQLEV